MLQKGCGGGVDEWPPRHLAPARRPDPARLHQHVERSPGDLHAPDRLDLGATDRLLIGDDRQRLDGGAGEPARLVRSEERRVGKEWVGKCRSRWPPDHKKKK